MEQEIRQQLEKYKGMIEQAPIGLVEVDRDGTLIEINLAGEEMLEPIMDMGAFDGDNIFPVLDYMAPEMSDKIKSFPEQNGLVFIHELHRFILPENDEELEKYFDFSCNKLSDDCLIISIEDMTEKLQKEQRMREIELDQAIMQGKFEIASNVLHDIGNAVVGFGSHLTRVKRLLRQDELNTLEKLADFFRDRQSAVAEALGKEKAEALAEMLRGIIQSRKKHLNELDSSISQQIRIISHIQEVLDIQRQYIRGVDIQERQKVVLPNIITDCVSMLSASLEKRGITPAIDIDSQLPSLKGDRTKLMQVMLNILKNAIEANDVESETNEISISIKSPTPNLLQIQITDNGTGFDPSLAEKLFERGFTTKNSGTGLGLYNCRMIVENHGGTIDIHSDGPGKGATVQIDFNL
ncbi:Signal transduction histidine kinase [Fodinibius roseus]|uniref:histidine kinase n=1 Tax=Fodinibius roseus TaxID=1194090 RepID=A0A1M5K2U3_9BACT|nr:PAS domain-containing sensor histidine kinase [Fodinibius roseus]SHG47118.1 Signal transduction histidine kinase [Fodinibius roseus]